VNFGSGSVRPGTKAHTGAVVGEDHGGGSVGDNLRKHSARLVWCGFSQPLSAHCFKLIFRTHYKYPG
jgi:hypothetical protein